MKRTKICTFSVSTPQCRLCNHPKISSNCVYQYLLLSPFYSCAKLYKDLIHTRLYQKFINNVVKKGPFSVHVLSFKMEINSEIRFENTLQTCIICADSQSLSYYCIFDFKSNSIKLMFYAEEREDNGKKFKLAKRQCFQKMYRSQRSKQPLAMLIRYQTLVQIHLYLPIQ